MKINRLEVSLYKIPTEQPEADGTLDWHATTLLLVDIASASGLHGLGFSYASTAAASLVHDVLAALVIGKEAEENGAITQNMLRAVRNARRQA